MSLPEAPRADDPRATAGSSPSADVALPRSRPANRSVVHDDVLLSHGAWWAGLRALSPRRYPTLFGFALVASVLAVLVTFGPFVPAIRAPLAALGFGPDQSWKLMIAAAIYDVVMVRGLLAMLTGLGLSNRERIALAQIENRCEAYTRRLDALPFSLGDPVNPFFFGGALQDPAMPRTAAWKMTENVRRDAAGRRFDPVNLIVDRVSGTVGGQSLKLREAQQLGVRLGILGTFIGIVFSLGNVGPIVRATDLDNAAIQSSIQLIVGSLGIAFATSIAGLCAAILLQVMAGIVRSLELDLIELLERQASTVQLICRRASEDTPLGEDIAALRSVIGEHTGIMRAQEKDLIAVSSRFGDALSRTENTLARPITALEQSNRRLAELIGTQSEAIGGLERMTASVAELETRVAGHFEAAARHAGDTQRASLLDLAQTLHAVSTALRDEIRSGWGRDARENFETLVDHRLSEAAGRLDAAAERQYAAMRRIAVLLSAALATAAVALFLLAGSSSGLFAWALARLTRG